MKQALHFGAGNIGRGFIGKVLAESGYHVTFVDVNHELIEAIQRDGSFTVYYAEPEKRHFTIPNISGLDSNLQDQDVVAAIADADLVTTAVGAHILPYIAPLISRGLSARLTQQAGPLNVIACENAVGGSDLLKAEVYKELSKEEQQKADEIIGFPNAAVDRIVPNQHQENILDVLVEPFFEWVVDASTYKGELPAINDIHFVEKLEAYIERKLFTVNTGHALAAYTGYQARLDTVQAAMKDKQVLRDIRQALAESGDLVSTKHGFDREEHDQYIEKILSRFQNQYIIDDITRVARQPIKKLGTNERLISPIRQLLELDRPADGLMKGAAAALQYDYEGDEEARELQKRLQEHGPAKTLAGITGLDEASPVIQGIVKQMK
ncbi:mannitol-1-phosphate 5-dehydrogenase [Salisediminibacterium beveridgei]|uniref:Mannitol-1-phosphate 5-dehydrogenase n=1 Tax=Salisediminibacterium beveridgei TaxID=632773 RepID=A0A1D7QZ40_9BACI|nr:mannitol-1-phosphate 5-dehydrogenase [Salisediminibacterium beveridgei]AOM84275.1 Mannitol-1-phosphate 5-dehydrogenase [Salisediminibacterium beveridgei]